MRTSNVGKVRRRVTVRGKRKTYQRTMMISAQQLGMKALHRELKQERANKRSVPMERGLLRSALAHLPGKHRSKTSSHMYSSEHGDGTRYAPGKHLARGMQYAAMMALPAVVIPRVAKHTDTYGLGNGASFATGVATGVGAGYIGGRVGHAVGGAIARGFNMSEATEKRWARRAMAVGALGHAYHLGTFVRSINRARA